MPLPTRKTDQNLILADESTAGPFVIGGTLKMPPTGITAALQAIRKIKIDRGIAPEAKLHCRVLFGGSARLKSPFKHLDVKGCHEILSSCVDEMNNLGASWFGVYCNASEYPNELRLVDGQTFAVSAKHVAALTVNAALLLAEGPTPSDYQFAFDPDPSMIDWGLAARTQATHFSRTHPAAIELTASERPLIDMADIAAYALAQTVLAKHSPPEVPKWWREQFPPLLERMKMQTAHFDYRP